MTEHEKIELPKFMCEWLEENEHNNRKPLGRVEQMYHLFDEKNRPILPTKVDDWIREPGCANQWNLIDALRYGYEAEPEPRWGIKAGNCYMENITEWSFESIVNTSATLAEFDYFTDKAKADELVKTLGFGEVVDLNKEVEADD